MQQTDLDLAPLKSELSWSALVRFVKITVGLFFFEIIVFQQKLEIMESQNDLVWTLRIIWFNPPALDKTSSTI